MPHPSDIEERVRMMHPQDKFKYGLAQLRRLIDRIQDHPRYAVEPRLTAAMRASLNAFEVIVEAALPRDKKPEPEVTVTVEPKPPFVPTAYLLAGALEHGVRNGEIDWKWERKGPAQFKTPWGERVHVVANCRDAMRGFAFGTRIYAGWEWWRRDDYEALTNEIKIGRFIVCDPFTGAPYEEKLR